MRCCGEEDLPVRSLGAVCIDRFLCVTMPGRIGAGLSGQSRESRRTTRTYRCKYSTRSAGVCSRFSQHCAGKTRDKQMNCVSYQRGDKSWRVRLPVNRHPTAAERKLPGEPLGGKYYCIPWAHSENRCQTLACDISRPCLTTCLLIL